MNYRESYEFIRDKFITFAEAERRPISPTLGVSSQAEIGGGVYFEWYYDRMLQIAISNANTRPELDYSTTTYPYKSEELPVLDIYTTDVRKHLNQLWRIRSAWFDFDLSVEDAERAVKKIIVELGLP